MVQTAQNPPRHNPGTWSRAWGGLKDKDGKLAA